MLQEINCLEILEYREDTYGINRVFEYGSDNIDGENFDGCFYNKLQLIYKTIISVFEE